MAIKYKSEEVFGWWASNLMDAGLIDDYKHHPHTFTLTPKQTFEFTEMKAKKNGVSVKQGTGFLMHEWKYSPDFWIVWNESAHGLLHYPLGFGHNLKETVLVSSDKIIPGKFVSVIECKPDHKFQKEAEAFAHKQKAMFAMHGIYVNLFSIPKSFHATFVPEKFLYTEVKGDLKKEYQRKMPRDCEEFIRMRMDWYKQKHG